MKIIIPTIGTCGDVQQLGVGLQPIPRSKPKVETMASALHLMQSPDMCQRAAELGAAIRAEADGVAEAVRLIEEFLSILSLGAKVRNPRLLKALG